MGWRQPPHPPVCIHKLKRWVGQMQTKAIVVFRTTLKWAKSNGYETVLRHIAHTRGRPFDERSTSRWWGPPLSISICRRENSKNYWAKLDVPKGTKQKLYRASGTPGLFLYESSMHGAPCLVLRGLPKGKQLWGSERIAKTREGELGRRHNNTKEFYRRRGRCMDGEWWTYNNKMKGRIGGAVGILVYLPPSWHTTSGRTTRNSLSIILFWRGSFLQNYLKCSLVETGQLASVLTA